MIRLIPTTTGGTTPYLYGVEICENICNGYSQSSLPSAVINVATSGSIVSAGGVSIQPITFSVVLTYQPDPKSTATKVRTFAETIEVSVPGSATSINPTIGSGVNISATKIGCCGRANGVRLLTSVSVAFA